MAFYRFIADTLGAVGRVRWIPPEPHSSDVCIKPRCTRCAVGMVESRVEARCLVIFDGGACAVLSYSGIQSRGMERQLR